MANKVTLHDGVVSLEIKREDEYPTQYTIYVGPREKEKSGRTRIQFSEENFAALQRLIREAILACGVEQGGISAPQGAKT